MVRYRQVTGETQAGDSKNTRQGRAMNYAGRRVRRPWGRGVDSAPGDCSSVDGAGGDDGGGVGDGDGRAGNAGGSGRRLRDATTA